MGRICTADPRKLGLSSSYSYSYVVVNLEGGGGVYNGMWGKGVELSAGEIATDPVVADYEFRGGKGGMCGCSVIPS